MLIKKSINYLFIPLSGLVIMCIGSYFYSNGMIIHSVLQTTVGMIMFGLSVLLWIEHIGMNAGEDISEEPPEDN